MKRFIAVLAAIVLLPLSALAESNPKAVAITGITESTVVFIGAVRTGGWSVTLEPATWITVITSEALVMTFNNTSYLDGAAALARTGVTASTYASYAIPIGIGTHVFSCSATTVTFTSCNGGDVTIYVEYRKD